MCVGNMPKKLTIEEMQRIAESRGGKCLSEKYINNRTKLKWQCEKGHIWEAAPRRSWCPYCSENKNEDFNMEFDDMSKQIIEGCLLGDGCIDGYIKRKNRTFRICCIKKEYIEYLKTNFEKNGIKVGKLITYKIKDRDFGDYISKCKDQYSISLYVYKEINKFRDMWYKNKKKIIPSDLKLTSINLLHWFIGDGSFTFRKNKKGCWAHIQLSTNCFSLSDINNLLNKLKVDLNLNFNKYEVNPGQYKLSISNYKEICKFFDIIKDCPKEFVNDYGYKWPTEDIFNYLREAQLPKKQLIFYICDICKEMISVRSETDLKRHEKGICQKCNCNIMREKTIDKQKEKNIERDSLYYSLYEFGYSNKEIKNILDIKNDSYEGWKYYRGL